ncbi:MAG: IS1380 family transposase, partial [Rhodococcus sp. (in: high G+C Gram-positive bacteria)]
FNLTRAAATLTGDPKLTKATTATIRDTIVTVPARVASSARKRTLHLPTNWQWEIPWTTLFDSVIGQNPPLTA